MNTFPNIKDSTILRLDILQEGATFNTGNDNHDGCLILENSNGQKEWVEFINLQEFSSYYSSFTSCPSGEVVAHLVRLSEDFDDNDIIECSLYNEDIICHLEDFRISEHNQSSLVVPFSEL